MMKHWIIDRELAPLPSWLSAMPDATLLRREQVASIPVSEAGILWFRLRAGESPEDLLAGLVRGPAQLVVLLCDEPGDAVIMQAMAAGAAGCCNTHAAPEVLAQVALVVANGGLWIGQSLLQRLVGTTSQAIARRQAEGAKDDWSALLSEREAQVARLVAGGASNKEVARQLEITERTIKAHLTAIFEKLGLRDRLQLSLRINGLNV